MFGVPSGALASLATRGCALKLVLRSIRWQRSGIFEAFYKDMTRWSFTFQMSAYITRVGSVEDAMSKASSTRRFIGERSWCSDAYVFEPLLYRDGHISEMEHHAYQEWWR